MCVRIVSLVPVLIQFSLTFLLLAKLRVRFQCLPWPAFQQEDVGVSWSRFRGCWWSAWAVRSLSFQPEMLLYLCPFADQLYFCLQPTFPLKNLACSPGSACTRTSTHTSWYRSSALKWNLLCLTNYERERRFSPMEPAVVSFVVPIILCYGQTSQVHQGPLDGGQVLTCRHATIPHEQQQ